MLLPKFTQADKIVDISAGNQCSAALDNAGKVYTWGYNGHGQLAHSNYSTYTSPKLVETDKAMVSVNMDYNQLALIQNNGTVWMSGDNASGQLGDGTNVSRNKLEIVGSSDVLIYDSEDLNTPLYGALFMKRGTTKTLKASFDLFNVFEAVTSANEFEFGSNRPNVLTADRLTGKINAGTAMAGTAYISVTEKTYTDKVAYIKVAVLPDHASLDGTFLPKVATAGDHGIALKADGSIWTWGLNASGQLGTGDTKNVDEPTDVTPVGKKFKDVAAGKAHTLAVASDGTL